MKKPTIPPGRILALFCMVLIAGVAHAAEGTRQCGTEGVWIQTLGAGGPELDDGFGSASYLVWIDNKARLLIDTAPGASVAFDRSGARFEDLDAILYTHLHVDHAADFPAFIKGSFFLDRTEPLYIFGPDGNDDYPSTTAMVERLIGPDGAFSYLQDFLTSASSGGYRLRMRDVPATGSRRWAQYRNERLRLTAVPVNHSIVPAIAWRVDMGEQSIVFTGDFNNEKDNVADLAADADALVIHHAIPVGARGEARNLHVLPAQIGRIAARAEVRMVLLGHRMSRTRGVESRSREAIEAHYTGPLIFVNDLECWGL